MHSHQEINKAQVNMDCLVQPEPLIESECSLQSEETRCRICFDTHTPLVSLCACTGTIGFVHEGCILDWITQKLETIEQVEVPKCEICGSRYSARMTIGRKRICYQTLKEKIKDLRWKGIIETLFYLIGFIIAIYVLVIGFSSCRSYIRRIWEPTEAQLPLTVFSIARDSLFSLCRYWIFPLFFIKAAHKHWKRRERMIEGSMIQIVEVTLLPKVTIKNNR